MAEQAQTPEEPDAPASEIVEDHIETVRVRRVPKYSVFLAVGAALGVVVALILTFAFNGAADTSPNTGMVYSQGQVFGFLALICITGGVVLGAVVALIFDRVYSRRTHEYAADRARIHIED